jgi:hypothetical protein
LLSRPGAATLRPNRNPDKQSDAEMSWALDEFFAAVEEEFGVTVAGSDHGYLDSPAAVIDFVTDQTAPADGMTEDDYREHVASVVGELMARTLGITRYREDQKFVEDLHVR